MDIWIYFAIATLGNLALVVFVAIWVFRTVDEIRAESRRAAEIAEKVRVEWDDFNRKQSSQIAEKLTHIEGRAKTLEEDTGSRLEEYERGVKETRIELQRLERYLRDVFEVELKHVFDSFDHTTRTVLEEMRNQLLAGVERIDEIRNLVEGRDAVEGRLIEGGAAVQSLTEGDQGFGPFESEGEETEFPDTGEEADAEKEPAFEYEESEPASESAFAESVEPSEEDVEEEEEKEAGDESGVEESEEEERTDESAPEEEEEEEEEEKRVDPIF